MLLLQCVLGGHSVIAVVQRVRSSVKLAILRVSKAMSDVLIQRLLVRDAIEETPVLSLNWCLVVSVPKTTVVRIPPRTFLVKKGTESLG